MKQAELVLKFGADETLTHDDEDRTNSSRAGAHAKISWKLLDHEK